MCGYWLAASFRSQWEPGIGLRGGRRGSGRKASLRAGAGAGRPGRPGAERYPSQKPWGVAEDKPGVAPLGFPPEHVSLF